MLLGDILSINARKYPEKVALVDGDRRLTFSEINRRVNCLSNALLTLGVRRGDRICMRAKNCTQWFEFFFAAAKCGAIAVPVNPFLKAQEFSYMIQDSGSQVLFIQETDIPFCRSLPLADLGVRHIICLEKGEEGFQDYEKLLQDASPAEVTTDVKEDEPAMIVYTSGTTGPPKGVTISHRNSLTDTRHIVMEMLIEHHHVFLLLFPFFHTAAISQMFRVWYVGATQVLSPQYESAGYSENHRSRKDHGRHHCSDAAQRPVQSKRVQTIRYQLVAPDHLWGGGHADRAVEARGDHARMRVSANPGHDGNRSLRDGPAGRRSPGSAGE